MRQFADKWKDIKCSMKYLIAISVTPIVYLHKKSMFEVLFTLFDPPHLFKNIDSNWWTEKTKTLKFQNPNTNKRCTAEWKDLTKIYKEEIAVFSKKQNWTIWHIIQITLKNKKCTYCQYIPWKNSCEIRGER